VFVCFLLLFARAQALPWSVYFLDIPPVILLYLPASHRILNIPLYPCIGIGLYLAILQQIHCIPPYPTVSSCIRMYLAVSSCT